MEDDLRAIGRPDDDVGLGQAPLEIAALAATRAVERASGDGFVGVEQRLELLPLDRDQAKCRACLVERIGAEGCDRLALVGRLVCEHRDVAGADRRPHAGRLERRGEVDPLHPGPSVRASEHGGVEHPGQRDVGREKRLSTCAGEAVDTSRRAADDLAGPGRPLLERVLLDDEEDLLEPALHLLLGADQSRHVRIASSIFG